MRKFAEHEHYYDEDTIAAIAEETNTSPTNAEEILMSGLLYINMINFYRHYGNEDSEESMEEVAADGTSQTKELYWHIERVRKVMSTFESLNYRARAIVSEHLSFCQDCYATYYCDKMILIRMASQNANPEEKMPFIELAVEHGLSSPNTVYKTYHKALKKIPCCSVNTEQQGR